MRSPLYLYHQKYVRPVSLLLHSHRSKVHSLSIGLRLAPLFLVLLLPFLGRLGNTLPHLP